MATRSSSRNSTRARDEILAMLKDDHKRVRKAFRDFEKLDVHEDAEAVEALVQRACSELELHAALEEELFYPAARDAMREEDLLDEAEVEHMTAKMLIGQLKGMGADDEKFAATFTVLGEYVKHHVKEEEKELFEQLMRARIDWPSLLEEMQQRRTELMEEMGLAAPQAEPAEDGGAAARSAARA
ncbi:hemerythrin domain-containing protein [Caldimonas tepidiphila]|uniref:hemerythrin domain-containing protein n=1 Tax=Caldimonas tepidiphila TaxID=2315841 RepID=UPI000E5C07EA|nr:hemerythrin domain-containing protein [Caldimonas tepidiphila]